MAITKTDVANMALLRIGVTQFLTDVDTDTRSEAVAIKLIFDRERDYVLRDFAWPFARKYADLALFAGSTASPANSDWIYAYVYPSDAVFVRRIVNCAGRQECDPPPFLRGRHADGTKLIYTNQQNAGVEYTVQVADPAQWDECFVSMLAWRIAGQIALPFSRMPDASTFCKNEYDKELAGAKTRALLEGEYAIASGEADPRIRDIFNLALTRIGISRNVVAADPELQFAALWPRVCFHDERDYVLRDFAWPFATKYADLTLVDGQNVTANRVQNPSSTDWLYVYRYPSDCVFARRITTPAGRYERNPPPFRIGGDYTWANDGDTTLTLSTSAGWTVLDTLTVTASAAMFAASDVGSSLRLRAGGYTVEVSIEAFVSETQVQGKATLAAGVLVVPGPLQNAATDDWDLFYSGRTIWTSFPTPTLEYTQQVTDPARFDASFISLLAWRLAALMAPSIAQTKNNANLVTQANASYELEKQRARARALNEGQMTPPLEAEWIDAREGLITYPQPAESWQALPSSVKV